MSTHYRNLKYSRQAGFFFNPLPFSVVLLFAMQLFLLPFSSTTLAASRVTSADPPEDLARAGVSLVRLLVIYEKPGSHPLNTFQCTGLGILVDNWTSAPPQQDTSILTDGNLLSTHGSTTCVPNAPVGLTLTSVQIFFNKLYNNTQPIVSPPFVGNAFTVTCQDTTTCSNGLALFSYHSPEPLPFVDLSQETSATNAFGLSLGAQPGSAALPTASGTPQVGAQVPLLLTPNHALLNGGAFQGESGAPVVDPQGKLLGIHLSNGEDSTIQGIQSFFQQEHIATHPETVLQQSWRLGVVKYYEKPVDPVAAKVAFQKAFSANTQFEAANDFASRAISSGSNTNGNGGITPVRTSVATTQPNSSFFPLPDFLFNPMKFGPLSFPFWVLIAGAILAVLVLVAIISLLRTALRRRQEYGAAERKAAIEAKRISAQESEHSSVQSPDWLQQPTLPMQQSPILSSPSVVRTGQLPRPDMHCPRCGELVPTDANYCTHCRQVLSPSESGFHLRVKPTTAPQPIVLPPAPAAQILQPSLQSQPTLTSQLASLRPSSIVDHPTIEIQPVEMAMNGAHNPEQTTPFLQVGQRLGFAVGAYSDPGIKRKQKPNEDSLFAAQGPRESNISKPPFGLFVIADGMGGHANGQDASRRAIQSLIDYMLPRLIKSADASPDALQSLLLEGIQQANQAVHQNNVELRADMGTTITATLMVDTTAYICNVGDSRTYLYRQGEGLRKVTNDHSVVASLVEAGIIKPDDMYTHPKRNQIYRSLGEKPIVEVDPFQVTLQPGDKLLLCSDGLWEMVRDPKIEDVIKSPAMPDPKQTASALIKAALEGGGEDNVSVIVISVINTPQYGSSTEFQLIAKPDSVQVPQI
jgi:serine/threonine protein phosphatase PrpC